jgi:hypothetical protein
MLPYLIPVIIAIVAAYLFLLLLCSVAPIPCGDPLTFIIRGLLLGGVIYVMSFGVWWYRRVRRLRATTPPPLASGTAGSQAVTPPPTPTWEAWRREKKPLVAGVGVGLQALIIACMYGESRENSRGLLLLLLACIAVVFILGLSSEESYLMETLFSPTPGKHPNLLYWWKYRTDIPLMGGREIRFWHIWCGTVFFSVFFGVLKNQPWGWFVWIAPTLFLWNQLLG